VIDHFSSAAQEPFSTATTMEALRPGIEIFHALLRDGTADLAFLYFNRELSNTLIFNLEELHRCQGFISSFFVGQPEDNRTIINSKNSCTLMNICGINYFEFGKLDSALACFSNAISRAISCREIGSLITFVSNYAHALWRKSNFGLAFNLINELLRVRDPWATDLDRFILLLASYRHFTQCGRLAEADECWQELDPMGRDWPIQRYRQGSAETAQVRWHFHNGTLTEQHLAKAESVAHSHAASRFERRSLLVWRGLFELSRGDLHESRNCFGDAAKAAREVDLHDSVAEAKYLELGVTLGEEVYSEDLKSRIDALLRHPECSEIDLAELCHVVKDSARAQLLACAVITRIESQGSEFFGHYDRKRAQSLNYDCQLNNVSQLVTEVGANLPPWYDAFISLLDDLNSFDEAGDIPDSLIGGLGHLIHKLKAKDTTGRWAYYFVLVMPKYESSFLSAIDGDGNIDLEDYGKVVASCYGEEPSEEVRNLLKEKYGFDV
jgi:tetratricopeptide (TPR) repeat protein